MPEILEPVNRRSALFELAKVFLKLGTTAFGGPAAHIAMMEDEVVRRRGWLTTAEFVDLLGATNLIPGPNSTEMAIHVGWHRAGWAGLLVAGSCFILPAALIVTAIASFYVRFRTLPEVSGLLYGVKPVIIAVIAQALWRLGRSVIKSPLLAAAAAIDLALVASGVDELVVLFGTGAVLAVGSLRPRNQPDSAAVLAPHILAGGASALVAASSVPYGSGLLFLTFLKIGSVLFGSGYVLLAFLRAEFVTRLGWLSEAQLLDATAVGQITPGPLFTTATFIGYLLDGASGAALATLGIFLPAFFFVAVSGPFIPRIRRSPVAGAFLDGVNAASLALMAWVTWELARAAIIDLATLALAAASAILILRYRLNSAWLVLGGGALGALIWTVFP